MSDIETRLREAFNKLAVCHCGNGIADGCCDNHAPSWNPCPDSQLLDDARNEIARLRSVCKQAADTIRGVQKHLTPRDYPWIRIGHVAQDLENEESKS